MLVTATVQVEDSVESAVELTSYPSVDPLLEKASCLIGYGKKLPDQALAYVAMDIQSRQNAADSVWIRDLDLPEDLATMILARMMARGACWLELVEQLVKFEGDYRNH